MANNQAHDPRVSLAVNRLAQAVSLIVSRVIGGPTPFDAGLIWVDGVEPTDSAQFPVDPGNRIWYVDFDSATDGDGSEGNPYNNLTHFGYFDGVSFQAPDNAYAPGDHLWLTGTASAAKHANGSSNMNWYMTDESLLGTSANPTVIRSWKGRTRVVFDGEFSEDLGLFFEPTTDGADTGVVVLNIETKRTTGISINVGLNVNFSRVVSCWVHHNQAIYNGPNSSYGGLAVRTASPGVDHRIYSNLVHDNNTTDGTTLATPTPNMGGINILADQPYIGNVVKVYQNVVYNEVHAIRGKHASDFAFEAYNNVIHDCLSGFYLRNDGTNSIHHNVVYDITEFLVFDVENSASDKSVNVFNNTIARYTNILGSRDIATYEINPLNFYKNICYSPSSSDPGITLGGYSYSGFNDALVSYDNVIYMAGYDSFFIHNSAVSSFSDFKATHSDTTSVTSDPLFTDAEINDFTLQAGSPAIALGAGAL